MWGLGNNSGKMMKYGFTNNQATLGQEKLLEIVWKGSKMSKMTHKYSRNHLVFLAGDKTAQTD